MVNVVDRDTQMCISLASRPGNHGNRFHNYLYDLLGLNFIYKSFSSSNIGDTIAGVRSLGIRGVSVSMPYKESCIPFLDALDPSASAIESVNTIVNTDGSLTGYNTDYIAVRSMLAAHRVDPDGGFAVRGSGGMAKAVVAALRDHGFDRGVIFARNKTRGTALAQMYGYRWAATLEDPSPLLLVNATPIGMSGGPESDLSPFNDSAVAASRTVFDVVYDPPETPLMRLGAAAGKQILGGAEVIKLQAMEQFALYTGVRPTDDQVERAEAYAWSQH